MWIKICANTNLEDAQLAAELGANAVGFVFAPSKRQVTAEQVAAIVPKLPFSLEKVGVFMSRDADEIVQIAQTTGLTGVQLHGGFDLGLAWRLHEEFGDTIAITQTLHWTVDGEVDNAEEIRSQLDEIAREPAIHRVLIDSKTSKGAGGTGIAFDWEVARSSMAEFPGQLIVAGGLRPDNVQAAVSALKPWGVDVASGVEAGAGRKDPVKLQRFIEASRKPIVSRCT